MILIKKGRLRALVAENPDDVMRAQALRAKCFGTKGALDQDSFDARCTHFLIEDTQTDTLLCTFRSSCLSGRGIDECYSGQFYDLSKLAQFPEQMIEVGRFCVDPGQTDPNVLRLAWAALAAQVQNHKAGMLFGCSSFVGTDPQRYLGVFDLLHAHHAPPDEWSPARKSADVFAFSQLSGGVPDHKAALRMMPPLLRTYLIMGGWVSDHAVIDHEMNSLHVFTSVQVRNIPAARKRRLLQNV